MFTYQNRIMRSNTIIVLILALAFTGLIYCPNVSYAATGTETVSGTVTVNDLAYYDIWKHMDGTWQRGIHQGSEVSASFTIGVSGALSMIPDNVTNLRISCIGEFDLGYDDDRFYDFAVISGYLSAGPVYNESNKTLSYTVNTTLLANSGINGYDIKQPDQAEIVEGYRYYIPTVIYLTYQYEIETGDLMARLDLPSSAEQGESYTASDASSIDDSLTVEEAVLEKHYGDGDWEEAAVWYGTGEPGESTGGSVEESCDEICTVTYHLTVTATNGQSDTDIKTIRITDGREIDGQAILELPAFTYEGHPALAEDISEFTVDGVDYSARRAYEEDAATNRFRPLPNGSGTAHRESLTTANVVFPARGSYHVRLEVETADGQELTDTKPITVRKTPYIIDNLGGVQKQNRKQILTVSVATYPGKPITDYYIKLRDLKTGEEIMLTRDDPQESSTAIKTRALTSDGDQYWTEFTLEFLTKTPAYDPEDPGASQDFRYTVFMRDSKGDTDTVQKDFTVVPDLPPDARIAVQDTFIRSRGTNIAEIQAEDSSTTDGDQLQRIWTVKGADAQTLPGFRDNSFGSRQKVQYDKIGVGHETIDLLVKDVWTEPTLEEYVTADDYKSASASVVTDVINIAPTVRLEPKEAKEADVAILTTKASQSGIEAGINSIKAELIEAGIDANLQILPTAVPDNGGYRAAAQVEWPVSINCGTCQSTGLLYDSEYAYRAVSAARTMSGYQEVCINPHTIYAMDADGNTAWSYTVNEFGSFKLALDQQEKYVYVISSEAGRTILLNRKNGAYLVTLNVALPPGTFVLQDSRIYILTGSNIQCYDTETNTLRTAAAVGGSLGRLMNGRLTFVAKESPYKFNIVSFDPVDETIAYRSLPHLEEYPWTAESSGVYPTDMDTTGKVTFTQTLSYDNDVTGIVLWLADAKNGRVYNLGKVISLNDARTNSVGFVKDETGKAVYMYHGVGDDNSTTKNTRYYYYLYLYTLGDGDDPPAARTLYGGQDNSMNFTGSVSYAQYHSDENAICLMMGHAWQGYDWGGRKPGLMYKIRLPGWSIDSDHYGWGWDAADEYGAYGDFLSATYCSYDNWTGMTNRVKLFKHSVTAGQAKESALTKFANFRNDVVHVIEDSFTSAEALVEKIRNTFENKEVMKITNNRSGLPASIMRSFNLTPGTTYYYEYELKDAKNLTGSALEALAPDIAFDTQNIYGGSENIESYYVSDVIEEDFNGTLNPFFTLDSGRITDGLQTPVTEKYGGNSRDLATASQISFTIPEGKTAAAVMDVSGWHGDLTASGWKSGAYINGQRYDVSPMTDLNIDGCAHPYLLKPGINTVTAYVCEKSRQIDTVYTKIDNLKILFLEKTPDTAGYSFSPAETGDGWTKVTGSFKTPQKISEFKSQEMAHFPDWPPGLATSVNKNYTYYDFAIPAGKAAKIHATFQGYTSRSDSTAGSFSFPGWTVTHRGTRSDSNGVLQYVNSGETWFTGIFQGTARFTTQAGNQHSVSFSKLETFVYPDNLLGKADFFFEGDKVYSPAETFSGRVSIQIPFAAGSESHIKNLKIFYVMDGKKIYIENEPLDDPGDLDNWSRDGSLEIEMSTIPKEEKKEDTTLVYRKGQLVSYDIFYEDYENDPSKKQYWRYTHTPYNDGPHPQAAVILDEDGNPAGGTGTVLDQSIPRFYIDGKYTVEHWQEDNTNRTGDMSGETDYTRYDKLSNTESITFYVEGGAAAPWITSIQTIPEEVKEGDGYQLQIGVDDAEKDVLRLTTELYKDKRLVYTHRQTGITADAGGTYPLVTTGFPPPAEPGNYEAVCTVRDWSGAGLGSYQFMVVSEGKVTGFVNHTDQWDQNRKKYNLKRFDEEGNRPMQLDDYTALPTPRMRGTNVFWSGEKFMLRAEAEGEPWKVDVQIQTLSPQGTRGNTGYTTELADTGRQADSGADLWEGSLWDNTMINKWGRKSPEQLCFVFTAHYAGGAVRTSEATVIIDSRQDYWQLHRLW